MVLEGGPVAGAGHEGDAGTSYGVGEQSEDEEEAQDDAGEDD